MRVGDQRQAPAALSLGKRPIACFNVVRGTTRPVGKGVENPAPTGTIETAASRYTVCATPAQSFVLEIY